MSSTGGKKIVTYVFKDMEPIEHLISPHDGGAASKCSCGKIFYSSDLAVQHVNWHLRLQALKGASR